MTITVKPRILRNIARVCDMLKGHTNIEEVDVSFYPSGNAFRFNVIATGSPHMACRFEFDEMTDPTDVFNAIYVDLQCMGVWK